MMTRAELRKQIKERKMSEQKKQYVRYVGSGDERLIKGAIYEIGVTEKDNLSLRLDPPGIFVSGTARYVKPWFPEVGDTVLAMPYSNGSRKEIVLHHLDIQSEHRRFYSVGYGWIEFNSKSVWEPKLGSAPLSKEECGAIFQVEVAKFGSPPPDRAPGAVRVAEVVFNADWTILAHRYLNPDKESVVLEVGQTVRLLDYMHTSKSSVFTAQPSREVEGVISSFCSNGRSVLVADVKDERLGYCWPSGALWPVTAPAIIKIEDEPVAPTPAEGTDSCGRRIIVGRAVVPLQDRDSYSSNEDRIGVLHEVVSFGFNSEGVRVAKINDIIRDSVVWWPTRSLSLYVVQETAHTTSDRKRQHEIERVSEEIDDARKQRRMNGSNIDCLYEQLKNLRHHGTRD